MTKRFGDVTAVDRMDLRIARGEFYSLLGPSGCGKTTTLRMIAGFEQPTEGEILLDGKPIAGVPAYKRNVNTVFQHYALFPHMDVARERRLRAAPEARSTKNEEKRRVGEALALVRLSGYEGRRTWEMSGGQQQRVALARALVNHPTVLLLDEPLGALDLKLRKEMQLELKALQREVGITFVYVTHDQEEALTMSDVIVVMKRWPDPAAGRAGGALRATRQPLRRRLHRDVQLHPGDGRRGGRDTADGDGPERTRSDPARHPHGSGREAGGGRPGDRRHPAGAHEGPRGRRRNRNPPAGWIQVSGRLDQGTYLGDQTEYRIHTDVLGELIARHQNSTGVGSALGASPGDPVIVRWHQEADLVLAG